MYELGLIAALPQAQSFTSAIEDLSVSEFSSLLHEMNVIRSNALITPLPKAAT
jgi:hypothetical protein